MSAAHIESVTTSADKAKLALSVVLVVHSLVVYLKLVALVLDLIKVYLALLIC